ncbi:MAG: ADP-glyceromanno-heptose 6-epimerase [Ignavibacteria bacterium]|nr:ADP-glyceromanno-heptose 6-epimerase [Ignavibacteria bacterium]
MIIVTGGAGFIGSALVWRLNQLGRDDIIIVDQFAKDEKYKNLIPLKFMDVFDKDEFGIMINEGFLEKNKFDVLYHLGACSSTTQLDTGYLLRNNYEYTKFLCEKSVKKNIRFIYASSAATYGNGSNGYDDNEDTLESLRPLNGYGYSKYLFDVWAKKNGYLKEIAGLKYFNVYGPNEYHKEDMRSVVNKAFYQIKETGKARLFKSYSDKYGDGEQKRDFIYVKDAVDMTIFFADNPLLCGIYNVATGKANTFNSFIKPIFKALGIKENIEYFEMPEILQGKYQDFTQANIKKLLNAGYKKEITKISDAVTDYISGYLNTDNPYLH